MKTVFATALAAAIVAAFPSVAAEVVDVSELTCAQFTAYDNDNKAIIMMWFEGYYTEENEPATIDFGEMASHLTKILIRCDANPDKKVLELTDEIMDD